MVDCCHELLWYAFSNYLLYNDCGHKFCIYVVNCSYELVQHSFSKHLLENTCDHKLCSFIVDGCHELIQYVFSKHLLDNNCDHKLCNVMVYCCHELVQYVFQSTFQRIIVQILYCSHELLKYVSAKHLWSQTVPFIVSCSPEPIYFSKYLWKNDSTFIFKALLRESLWPQTV